MLSPRWCISHGEDADGTDGQTYGRKIVTLRFLLDAASGVITFRIEFDFQ